MDTQHWLYGIDDVTASFQKEFGSLSREELNWKPNTSTWSLGQIVDHLIVINNTYYPIVRELEEGTYKLFWIGKVNFIVSFFGKFILQSVEPTRKRKMKTLAIWEPTVSHIEADILAKFVVEQNRLKEEIVACAPLLDRGVVISSPANRVIVYKLERAFDIIVSHERRHLQQARRAKYVEKGRLTFGGKPLRGSLQVDVSPGQDNADFLSPEFFP